MKKLKKTALVLSALIALLCAGCGNWVNDASIKKAYELCDENGGLKHLSIFAGEFAVCNNGAEFSMAKWKVST